MSSPTHTLRVTPRRCSVEDISPTHTPGAGTMLTTLLIIATLTLTYATIKSITFELRKNGHR